MSNKIQPHETKDAPMMWTSVKCTPVPSTSSRTTSRPSPWVWLVLLVVVGGVLGYKKFVAEPKAKEASELIWKAEYYFEIDSLEKAMNGDDQWPGFLTIADDFGSTPSGKLANYYLGTIYMQKGEFEMAMEHYKKADMDDDVLRVMAVGNQGDALVELGRTDEAVKLFEKAAAMKNNDLTTPMYLMKAGILHQQASNWSAAAKAFNRIANGVPHQHRGQPGPQVRRARRGLGG